MRDVSESPWVKNSFKMQDTPVDCNTAAWEKFISRVSESKIAKVL